MTQLPELHWAPYHEFGIPDPALETHEPPDVPVRICATGYRGSDITVYWRALTKSTRGPGIPAPGGIPASVWLAESPRPPSAVILGIVSTPEAGRAACQDVANDYLGAKNTPPLNWHGDDGHASTSYTDPSGTYFFQVTRFTVDEIREDTS